MSSGRPVDGDTAVPPDGMPLLDEHGSSRPDAPAAAGFLTRRAFAEALLATGLSLTLDPGSGGAAIAAGTAPAPPAHGRCGVREIETLWIPMPDGARLAARAWLPKGADEQPVPAILEYLPYHRRDFHRASDDARHPWWAAHGYACLRVDLRGSGDSDGIPQDEYVRQEQDDGLAVLAWIAAQPWCSGAIGMVGYSWGGINALQLAARRPPALKAIITHCSTPDRYGGDAHYKGGCVLQDQLFWGALWLTFQATPPDPATLGDAWRARWKSRLDALVPHLADWLEHPHRDAYWQHASIAQDYRAVQCPVYAIGGFADPYADGVLALLEHLDVPRKGLIGPWNHAYPHEGQPGPTIDYLTESLRWWDHWLKGRATGIMDEPMLRAWMHDTAVIAGMPDAPGRWIAETRWPSPRIEPVTLHLNAGLLAATAGPERALALAPKQTVGAAAGRWMVLNPSIDLPLEQSVDDGRSLCFDTDPLAVDLEILGHAVLELEVAVDQPVALLAARLNDVTPGGESRRVSYAVLNLCQRASDERPTPITPGERLRIRLRLDPAAHRFAAGHRIRVALSTAYWPLVLPSPYPVTLTVYAGRGRLVLPTRPASADDRALRPLGNAQFPAMAIKGGATGVPSQRLEWDLRADVQTLRRSGGGWTRLLATGTELRRAVASSTIIAGDNPSGASAEYRIEFALARGTWQPKVATTTRVELTPEEFVLDARVLATDGADVIAERTFSRRIRRRLV